jgi:hypothetical protein
MSLLWIPGCREKECLLSMEGRLEPLRCPFSVLWRCSAWGCHPSVGPSGSRAGNVINVPGRGPPARIAIAAAPSTPPTMRSLPSPPPCNRCIASPPGNRCIASCRGGVFPPTSPALPHRPRRVGVRIDRVARAAHDGTALHWHCRIVHVARIARIIAASSTLPASPAHCPRMARTSSTLPGRRGREGPPLRHCQIIDHPRGNAAMPQHRRAPRASKSPSTTPSGPRSRRRTGRRRSSGSRS